MKIELIKVIKTEKHVYKYTSSFISPNVPLFRTIDIIFKDGKFSDVLFPFSAPYTSADLEAIKEIIFEIKRIEDATAAKCQVQ